MLLKHFLVNRVEARAQVSHIPRLIVPSFETGHHTSELPEVIGCVFWTVFLLLSEQVQGLRIVSTTFMEIVLLHVQESKFVVKNVEGLHWEQLVLNTAGLNIEFTEVLGLLFPNVGHRLANIQVVVLTWNHWHRRQIWNLEQHAHLLIRVGDEQSHSVEIVHLNLSVHFLEDLI